jgi:hypothetical protein
VGAVLFLVRLAVVVSQPRIGLRASGAPSLGAAEPKIMEFQSQSSEVSPTDIASYLAGFAAPSDEALAARSERHYQQRSALCVSESPHASPKTTDQMKSP